MVEMSGSTRNKGQGVGETTMFDYLRMARFDHATKHVFILPGIAFALLLRGAEATAQGPTLIWNILVGMVAAVLVASANYTINEWLDREFDKFHPEKSQRAAVQNDLAAGYVYLQYAFLLASGLAMAALVNSTFTYALVALAVSGITYNVKPIRTKDRVFLDVLSESINNPIRLILGWTMVDGGTLPPISVLFAFWFGGAFLMNAKRLAEYRDIARSHGVETLGLYRRSFKFYSQGRLAVANLVYAQFAAFFIAIFLIKYRVEYLLVFPFVVTLFAEYFRLTGIPGSVAAKPEKLFESRRLLAFSFLVVVAFVVASIIDIPWIHDLTQQIFIDIKKS